MLRHNKAIHIGFLLATVFFAAGCAPSAPLAISLAVNKVPTVPLNIGAGTKVYPSVLDQRPDKMLGYRAMVLRWQGLGKGSRHVDEGPITVSEDVAPAILKSLNAGLSSLGFETLVAAEPSAPTLEVAVQRLRYELFECCPANFSSSITVKIYKDTIVYEKTYVNDRANRYSYLRASDRSYFEENFNAVLSDLMGQLLADLELIKALRE